MFRERLLSFHKNAPPADGSNERRETITFNDLDTHSKEHRASTKRTGFYKKSIPEQVKKDLNGDEPEKSRASIGKKLVNFVKKQWKSSTKDASTSK